MGKIIKKHSHFFLTSQYQPLIIKFDHIATNLDSLLYTRYQVGLFNNQILIGDLLLHRLIRFWSWIQGLLVLVYNAFERCNYSR